MTWKYESTKEYRLYVLPEPPSANRYWRVFRNRAVKTDAARAYCDRAVWLRMAGAPFSESVAVTIHWYRSRRSGDLDNRAKVVLDALQGVAFVRDSQVTELHMFRHDDKEKKGRVEVVVRGIAA